MARLNEAQWQEVKAAYEVQPLSNRELADKFKVSEGAIRLRAKDGGWIKGQSTHLVEAKLKAIKDIAAVNAQTTQLSTQHQGVIDADVAFRLQNDDDLEAIQFVARQMLAQVENPAALLALTNITIKHREARLGKTPLMAMQINVEDAPRGAFVFRTQLATDTIEQDDDE